MQSPLPDSSALEAGILEDNRPSRLSRVQDNVRNLLRNSRFSASPPETPHCREGLPPTPPESPTWRMPPQPEVLPSPSNSTSPSATTETEDSEEPTVHFARSSYRRAVQHLAHQSELFNTRAVAALNHPDLSDPSLAVFVQQKNEDRQRRAWKRPRQGLKRAGMVEAGTGQCVLCVLSALLLSATIATCKTSFLLVSGNADSGGRSCARNHVD